MSCGLNSFFHLWVKQVFSIRHFYSKALEKMVRFNFTYDANVGLEQRVGFEMAAMIWSSVLTDNIDVNLHIGAVDSLDNGNAVGGAIPILETQNYGVFQEYYKVDATSAADEQANSSMQVGNTVDLSINSEVIDGNSEILLTSAQAKALGMDEAIALGNGTTWDRGLVDANGLDGYIVINNNFDWSYDFTRSGNAQEGTLDFLSMALHEIGHNLGFVSGLDGALDVLQLHSGKTRIEDFTALDLFRHTVDTAELENVDGSVSSVSLGENAYFSIDGGQTNLADFSTGKDTELGGDGFQASHWKRLQTAMGIMDPTLAYKERLSLSKLDLQAMDVLGWDVNYQALETGIDFEAILRQSEQSVASSLGIDSSVFANSRTDSYLYSLSHDQLLDLVKEQMFALGYSRLWQAFELGYSRLWQEQESSEEVFELGYSRLWQEIESQMLSLGYSRLWQEFQEDILELGYSRLWQAFELSYSRLWQEIDPYLDTINNADNKGESEGSIINRSTSDKSVIVSGGKNDDILAGSHFRDLVSGGGGDDLIDGKSGNDNLLGEAGNDILYGDTGNDELYGGDGDDFLAGEAGNDKLVGEDGHDILAGGFGNDLVEGNVGRDFLKGDAGRDVLDGGIGNDKIEGGEGDDIAIGGKGEDIVNGGSGDDVIYGDEYLSATVGEDGNVQPMTLEEISRKVGFSTAEDKPVIDFWVRLEAEDLKLRNFNQERANASGGGIVSTGGRGEATAKFSGPTGIYDIVVGYYDEADGQGSFEVEIGERRNKQKFRWSLDKNLKNKGVGIDNFTTHTIRGVKLTSGEEIEIEGKAHHSEFIRLDYIDIISTTEGTAFSEAEFYNGSFYLRSQDKNSALQEAVSLGGQLIEAEKESAEGHWLNSTLNETKNIIKVNVSDNQFNLLQDQTALDAMNALRLEAETFRLSGAYEVEDRSDFASGKAVIANNNKKYGGQAATTFTGESGIYDVFVSYVDDADGVATANFGINGQVLDQWSFNAVEDGSVYRRVGTQIELNAGDSIELQGWAGKKDEARIDYVEFVASSEADEELPIIEKVRLEAENLSWGGKVDYKSKEFASGQKLIEAEERGYTSTIFSGESGLYDISVGYDDKGEGESRFSVSLEGNSLGYWNLAKGKKDQTNTQTLKTQVFINQGDRLSFQTGEEKVRIDYIDLSLVVDSSINTESTQSGESSSLGEEVIVEAESIYFSGSGSIRDNSSSSGGQYADLRSASGSTLFQEETGYYDIVVRYYDNGDSSSQLTLKLNEEIQDQWQPNQTGTNEYVERTVASGVKLTNASDYLQLSGGGNNGAFVDYIKLVRVANPDDTSGTAGVDGSTDSDILRGGLGNDIIYGGLGNDIIYGEDEFNPGIGNADSTSDVIFGGAGDDVIFGNSGNDTIYGDDDSEPVLQATAGGSVYNGSEYVLTDSRSGWQTAQARAQALGGNLVTINSAEEEQWLRDQFSGSESLWIGISDRSQEGNFEWSSGETVAYTNWQGSGPDNYYNQDYGVIEWTGSEGSQWQDHYETGGWEYRNGWQWQDGYRGIVEIKLPEVEVGDGGNDTIEGGRGNDTIKGGVGDDRLDGSDAIALGASEKDILSGGLGADTFILGNAEQSYYNQDFGNDYARIKDFDSSTDVLVLHGSADRYVHWAHQGDLRLHDGQDLIAVLEDTDSLNLNSSSVVFV